MASRFLIQKALELGKRLGLNPSKFLGTKTNIDFLGRGPKNNFFNSDINIEAIEFQPKGSILTDLNQSLGYLTGNKLNDMQATKLIQNMEKVDTVWNPPQIANITDMATGTRDLTQQGLGSLREGLKRFPEETHQFMGRPLKDVDFAKIDRLVAEGKIPPAEGIMGKGDVRPTYEFIDPTAPKASYLSKFNPKNEIHIQKAEALLKDPQIKGVYTEAEVKNAYDFEGLYQSHFDKGHVDVAQLFAQEGHNVAQMRSAARDALMQLMKKERGRPGLEYGLRDFVEQADFKYITEGGGGRAGDPLNLMVKYFGVNVTTNLPKNATRKNIDKFTDFVIEAKDSQGRGIKDPFFDREDIDFSEFAGYLDDLPPFATGGRVDAGGLGEILQVPRTSFRWGSGLSKALLRRINKKMVKDAVDDIFPTGDYKMDAELASEALVELNPKLFGGKLIDDLDDAARSDIYGLVLGEVSTRFGLQLKKQRGIKSLIKSVDEKFGEGTLKKASDLPKGTKYETLEAIKDFEASTRTFTPNREKIRAKYQGLIDDNLLNNILADNDPQRIAEVLATIDEALLMQRRGIGNESIMAALRDSWKRKPNASGGLAKILEV